MKKLLIFIAIFIGIFMILEYKGEDAKDIIPQGEYNFYKAIYSDGTENTRDDFEEANNNLDFVEFHIWSNNKCTLSKLSGKKYECSVTNELIKIDDDTKTELKYELSNNTITLIYSNNDKEVYIKDYEKELSKKYEEMVGHYELVGAYVNGKDASDGITDEIRKNVYIDLYGNNNGYFSGYGDYGAGFYQQKEGKIKYNSTRIYDPNGIEGVINYTYNNGMLRVYIDDSNWLDFKKN